VNRLLQVEPLTKAVFAPFGEVIERDGADLRVINAGTTDRLHALAGVDVRQGHAIISILHARRRNIPISIGMMERHPLGSQAFFPLEPRDWLVVVSEEAGFPHPASLRCFRARGDQGVNYHANVWHHPLLIMQPEQDFLVVDREGAGLNLEEVWFPESAVRVDVDAA
jgi:ureidoglycolate lyase